MIIDCFMFFNELELLEIRLEELKEVVDWFVLVEAAETFRGRPRDCLFEQHRERFQQYPICHVKIPAFPAELTEPWPRENYTRNALSQGLKSLEVGPSDIVALSDGDEIPRAEAVLRCARALESPGPRSPFVFEQSLYYFYVNCRCPEPWQGTRMARLGDIRTLQELRQSQGTPVADAGWHFSYLGGLDRVREKIGASAHAELDRPEFTGEDHLQRCIAGALDPFGRKLEFHYNPLDYSYPQYLVDNRERFSHLIGDAGTEDGGRRTEDEGQRTKDEAQARGTGREARWEGGQARSEARWDGGGGSKAIAGSRREGSVRGMGLADVMFREALERPSDIHEHLAYLYRLASTVDHVTEFGTRTGQSTCAFLFAAPRRLACYDLERPPNLPALEDAARENGVEFEFRQQDVLQVEIEQTDLLFIDTWHVEQQMRQELARHAGNVRRYLALHDTETFGLRGESEGHRGIWPAVADFLRHHPEWRLRQHFSNNNGLTVLVRLGKTEI